MSRSKFDYDFRGAAKPCDGNSKCVTDKECPWYEMCDLSQKNPPKKPTLPLQGTMAC